MPGRSGSRLPERDGRDRKPAGARLRARLTRAWRDLAWRRRLARCGRALSPPPSPTRGSGRSWPSLSCCCGPGCQKFLKAGQHQPEIRNRINLSGEQPDGLKKFLARRKKVLGAGNPENLFFLGVGPTALGLRDSPQSISCERAGSAAGFGGDASRGPPLRRRRTPSCAEESTAGRCTPDTSTRRAPDRCWAR